MAALAIQIRALNWHQKHWGKKFSLVLTNLLSAIIKQQAHGYHGALWVMLYADDNIVLHQLCPLLGELYLPAAFESAACKIIDC